MSRWKSRLRGFCGLALVTLSLTLGAAEKAPDRAKVTPKPQAVEVKLPATLEPLGTYPRAPHNWLEAQVALAREGFSCGAIDGVPGFQTIAALQAYQKKENIPLTEWLDDETRDHLLLYLPALAPITLTSEDLASLQPLSPTWLGKSQQTSLAYESALELVAERAHASRAFIRRLNPDVDWTKVIAGQLITAPSTERRAAPGIAARLHVYLSAHVLEVNDAAGGVIAHFPVSIAKRVDKRPVGELHVSVVIQNPDYTFDPEVFPESAEAQQLGRKLVLPPGPNNPVGVAWVGLDLPGYGIHGTPQPEMVGRTESHGCFRLANWDARALLAYAWVGLPVVVEP
ncbi:MAG: L,D-transpeptidase [Opitutaceae bacterium]